jgi:predicted glycosyltransferase
LGHATRCIPIIQLLLQQNAAVLIAGSGRSALLLQQEFPKLEFIDLPGYDIQYSKKAMTLNMFLSIPKILKGIKREHELLEEIVKEKKIDIVISDNRFGLWSTVAKTVFITHQLLIKAPLGEYVLHTINLRYIKKFTECWIPDQAKPPYLSGDLSHQYTLPTNASYIGFLSRFTAELSDTPTSIVLKKAYDVMIVLSGPEPQRSLFEELIVKQASALPLNFLLVRGITEEPVHLETKNNLDVVSHLNAAAMKAAMLASTLIVSRSGYSTLMDLVALKRKALFVPTPGQTEQEYLAVRCKKNKYAYFETQTEFNLERALTQSKLYAGFLDFEDINHLDLEKKLQILLID